MCDPPSLTFINDRENDDHDSNRRCTKKEYAHGPKTIHFTVFLWSCPKTSMTQVQCVPDFFIIALARRINKNKRGGQNRDAMAPVPEDTEDNEKFGRCRVNEKSTMVDFGSVAGCIFRWVTLGCHQKKKWKEEKKVKTIFGRRTERTTGERG